MSKEPFGFFDTGKSRISRELFVELGRAAKMALFIFFPFSKREKIGIFTGINLFSNSES